MNNQTLRLTKPRIAVNIIETGSKPSGNKTFILNVMREILEVASDRYEWYLIASGQSGTRMLEAELGQYQPHIIQFPDVATKPLARIFFEQVMLPLWLRRYSIDLLYATRNLMPLITSCPTVIGILSKHLNAEMEKIWWKRAYLDFMLSRSSAKAKSFVAISEYAGNTYRQKYAVPVGKINIAPLGYKRPYIDVSGSENPYGTYILFVSTLWPHKNVPFLLDTFSLLAERNPQLKLVIVGRDPTNMMPQLQKQADTLSITKQVEFLGAVSDEKLHELYFHTKLLVFPSLREGFGLTVLEAMSYGKPVVGSNCTSVPEVIGDGGIVLEPTNPKKWADAIKTVLHDETMYSKLSSNASQRAKIYTWERSAAITLDCLESTLNRS